MSTHYTIGQRKPGGLWPLYRVEREGRKTSYSLIDMFEQRATAERFRAILAGYARLAAEADALAESDQQLRAEEEVT